MKWLLQSDESMFSLGVHAPAQQTYAHFSNTHGNAQLSRVLV